MSHPTKKVKSEGAAKIDLNVLNERLNAERTAQYDLVCLCSGSYPIDLINETFTFLYPEDLLNDSIKEFFNGFPLNEVDWKDLKLIIKFLRGKWTTLHLIEEQRPAKLEDWKNYKERYERRHKLLTVFAAYLLENCSYATIVDIPSRGKYLAPLLSRYTHCNFDANDFVYEYRKTGGRLELMGLTIQGFIPYDLLIHTDNTWPDYTERQDKTKKFIIISRDCDPQRSIDYHCNRAASPWDDDWGKHYSMPKDADFLISTLEK